MTNWELFQAIGSVSAANLAEAEELQQGVRSRRPTPKHMLLVAAAIALALLLVGCAVVYVLQSQDLNIGKRNTTRYIFDEYHREIIGTEPVSQNVLTFSGLRGSPSYQAAKEWFDFLQSYDQDKAIWKAYLQNGEDPFPETSDTYGVYSQEMEDKLEALAEKYQLKLLGAPMEFTTMSGFARALGIDHVLLPESKFSSYLESNSNCYPGGNFDIDLELNMPNSKSSWPYTVNASLYYCRKDCLGTEVAYLSEDQQWEEWNYPTASGPTILILRAEEGEAYFFCDCGDATLTVQFTSGFDPETDIPDLEAEWMTDRQIEQIADAIDFTIRPQLPDASAAQVTGHPQGWELELKSVDFDGNYGMVVLHLTAPRGTKLPGDDEGYVFSCNDQFLFCGSEAVSISSWQIASEEDGDGKKNTTDLVYRFGVENPDDLSFDWNAKFTLRTEDLAAQIWDGQKDINKLIAQGVWETEIRFADCDRRTAELLSKPISYSNGRSSCTITSVQLRSLSVIFTTEEKGGTIWSPTVVLKDGTEVPMVLGDSKGGCSERNMTRTPIDLDQVDYIRLSDGRMLRVPEN